MGERVNPATAILLEETAHLSGDRWFVPDGDAALAHGIAASHPDTDVRWQPVDLRERDAVGAVPANLTIEDPGTTGDLVDLVILTSPPERDLARRWLLTARSRLHTGSQLVVAGANDAGIKSVLADASHLFGRALHEGYRSKHRFAIFRSGVSGEVVDWASADGIAPGSWEEFTLDVGDRSVPIVTQAGVFAGAKVDAGTRLLLDAVPDRVPGSVLDVGCGAGIIGIAAAVLGASPVTMTDVNLLAVQAARENARRLGLEVIDVVASDAFQSVDDRRFDLIVSNPPFHRGKAVDLAVANRLIAESPAHLTPGGTLLIVANAFLAYGRQLERVFERVEIVRSTRQYHVLQASDPR